MSRKAAREVAMRLLYGKEMTLDFSMELLEEMRNDFHLGNKDIEYIHAIVNGLEEHQTDTDNYIKDYIKAWRFDRIAKVDLAILRLAIYEILYMDDIPPSVSINEGIELAKKYSQEKSGSFINGVLGNIVRSLELKKDEQ